MENYFNYFTEIEEHFQKLRGKATLLSPLDWSLIESFQETGIPLESVLRGLEQAFKNYEKRKNKAQKINSLSYCTQAILAEYERQKESGVGKIRQPESERTKNTKDREDLIQLIDKAYERLNQALERLQGQNMPLSLEVLESATKSLQTIKTEVAALERIDYENLELRLSMLEDKIFASLLSTLSDETLMTLRTAVDKEIKRHRRGLKAEHVAMLEKKMMNKKVLDQFGMPRLSLFYLPLN